jgi:hypothetical protein
MTQLWLSTTGSIAPLPAAWPVRAPAAAAPYYPYGTLMAGPD